MRSKAVAVMMSEVRMRTPDERVPGPAGASAGIAIIRRAWPSFIRSMLFAVSAFGVLGIVVPVQAQGHPLSLVCFERKGIVESLDRVTTMQQFLRGDPGLRSSSCDLVALPSGSGARYLGIHRSPGGFLFPLYRITYATTGQRMYAADGVFEGGPWRVVVDRDTGIDLLMPARCDALDGYLRADGATPRYVVIPRICRLEFVR